MRFESLSMEKFEPFKQDNQVSSRLFGGQACYEGLTAVITAKKDGCDLCRDADTEHDVLNDQ